MVVVVVVMVVIVVVVVIIPLVQWGKLYQDYPKFEFEQSSFELGGAIAHINNAQLDGKVDCLV